MRKVKRMIGQYGLFGTIKLIKRRPCEYSFARYIGQEVKTLHGVKTISEIFPYYTYFTDGTIGTPHDMQPVNKTEHLESLRFELEYQESIQSREHDSVSRKNIENINKLISEEGICDTM